MPMRAGDPALCRQAQALLDAGQTDAAIAAFRAWLAHAPQDADAWYNLALLLRRAGQPQAALAAYDAALAHGIAAPEDVHLNRAVLLVDDLHDAAAAERALQQALALRPGHPPALLNLGNLHEEAGQRTPAIACYQRLLASPARDAGTRALQGEALARLAQLQPPHSADDPLLARLEAAAEDCPDPTARINLRFALGRALDRVGACERAFAAWRSANAELRRTAHGYDRAQAERAVAAIIAAFPATDTPAPADEDAAAPVPMFVCGMFRSGSTLLEQVLAAHPQAAACGELDFFPRLAAGPLHPFPHAAARLTEALRVQWAHAYRDLQARACPHAAQARFAIDKRPDNLPLLGLVKRVLPQARIVHTVRDPRDVALSIYMQHLDPRIAPYSTDLGDILHFHGLQQRLMAHWRACFPGAVHAFDYDAFVHAPEPTLRRLLEALGLDWHPDCLRFHERDGRVRTASLWQVRRPLHAQSSGRWRRYREYFPAGTSD